MKLLKKLDQNRRDFTGLYKCEGCGVKEKVGGCYDDDYFHSRVAPDKKCKSCGKSTNSVGIEPEKVITRYQEGETH